MEVIEEQLGLPPTPSKKRSSNSIGNRNRNPSHRRHLKYEGTLYEKIGVGAGAHCQTKNVSIGRLSQQLLLLISN